MATTPEQRLARLKTSNDLRSERVRAHALRLKEKALKALSKPAFGGPTHGNGVRQDRYQSAIRTRLRPGARGSGGSAVKHLTPWVLDRLRRDCQDLKHNSSAARIVMARAAQVIVGDGPIVTSNSSNPDWNKMCDELFALWFDAMEPDLVGHPDISERLSGPEMLAGLIGAACTDGDQLVLHVLDKRRRGAFQVVEGERLRSVNGARTGAENGTRMVDGVEMDVGGAARAYHVCDWDVNGNLVHGRTRTIPAESARLFINPIGVEAAMVRGVPALQACLDRIERLDSYDESTAVAAEIATRFCAIVESSTPADVQEAWERGTDNQPVQTNPAAPRTAELQTGLIHYMERGGRVTAMEPKFPTTNFRDFVLWQFMMIGAEIGVPVVAALYDAAGLSWSNIKALLSLSMRSVEPSQARVARIVRWIRGWKVQEWMESGRLPEVEDWYKCQIDMPRAPVVDFKSEVDGHIAAITNNLETQDQATQALGTGKASEIRAAREAERRDEEKRGIVPPAMPGAKPANAGAETGSAAEPAASADDE